MNKLRNACFYLVKIISGHEVYFSGRIINLAIRRREMGAAAVGFIFDGKLFLAVFCKGEARGFTKKISQLFPEDVTVLYYKKMGNPA